MFNVRTWENCNVYFFFFIKASWLQPDKNNRHQCICWFITNANNVSAVNTYGNEGIRNAFISFDYENKRQKDYQMKIAWFFFKSTCIVNQLNNFSHHLNKNKNEKYSNTQWLKINTYELEKRHLSFIKLFLESVLIKNKKVDRFSRHLPKWLWIE